MRVGKDTMHGSYGKLLITIVVDQVLLASGPQEGYFWNVFKHSLLKQDYP